MIEYLKWIVPTLIAAGGFAWAIRGGVIVNLRARVVELEKRIYDLECKVKIEEEKTDALERKNYGLLRELYERSKP
jgi:hypothetical protein